VLNTAPRNAYVRVPPSITSIEDGCELWATKNTLSLALASWVDSATVVPAVRVALETAGRSSSRAAVSTALYAVVVEAYVQGVSTRSVDDLVEAMGVETGISKSEVSWICAGLDEVVGA
jgi:hypothetical protein